MNIKRVLSIGLAGCLMVGCIGSVSAEGANEITTAGGTGTSSAVLTAEALNLTVTVPMTLPINVDANGKVTVADNAKIINKSAGPVKVKGVKVEAANGWTLAEYGDLFTEKVGTQKVGMQIQGTNVLADGTCAAAFDTIPANDEISVTYETKVAPQSEEVTDTEIAKVVFTVGWDKEYEDFVMTWKNRDMIDYSLDMTSFEVPKIFTYNGINYRVTGISDHAFNFSYGNGSYGNNPTLISVVLPDSLTSIGTRAFDGCDGLTTVTIPEGVTSIGRAAFESCDGLTTIVIPSSVVSIESYAFKNCPALTSITYKGTKSQWKAIKFGTPNYSDGTGLEGKTITCTDGTITASK